jgi:hypothetical protein
MSQPILITSRDGERSRDRSRELARDGDQVVVNGALAFVALWIGAGTSGSSCRRR